MEDKIKVYVTFDTQFQTWNVVKDDDSKQCFHYGTADSCDEWLKDNADNYIEMDNGYKVLAGKSRIADDCR